LFAFAKILKIFEKSPAMLAAHHQTRNGDEKRYQGDRPHEYHERIGLRERIRDAAFAAHSFLTIAVTPGDEFSPALARLKDLSSTNGIIVDQRNPPRHAHRLGSSLRLAELDSKWMRDRQTDN